MNYALKIRSRKDISLACEEARGLGKKIGFTSGVFDLLHPGHTSYLEKARSKVDLLVVAVNSDDSVRGNKGPSRPICGQDQRAAIVAALSSTDFVFIFDEDTNRQNVSELKPDVYFKAGDYNDSKLTSKPLVESYGGRVEIVQFEKGLSTSSIIEKVLAAYPFAPSIEGIGHHRPPAPALFVDRDGTLIEEVDYLADPSLVRPIEGAFSALKKLRDRGFRIVMVTNQPGIGLGYLSRQDFIKVNSRIFSLASAEGALFDRICFCPHSKSEDCSCRKPGIGLLQEVVRDLNIDISHSWVVGDMTTDLQLAANLGCRSVLVRTGKAGNDSLYPASPTTTTETVVQAVQAILDSGELPANDDQRTATLSAGESIPSVSLEQVGRYSAFIGHDFNNILGSIRGCIDLIRQKLGARADQEEHPLDRPLRMLEAASQRGLELTRKLGGFARPEQQVAKVDLRGCLEYVVDLLIRTSHQSEVLLEVHPTDGIYILGTEHVVTQMVLQLVKNAVDAMQHLKDRTVLLLVEISNLGEEARSFELEPGEYIRISIIDHGAGIKRELQETVFTPFFSTKVRGIGKGLGLSLSMARVIMRQHNGALTLSSKPQIGTTISLLFPRLR